MGMVLFVAYFCIVYSPKTIASIRPEPRMCQEWRTQPFINPYIDVYIDDFTTVTALVHTSIGRNSFKSWQAVATTDDMVR